MADNVKKAWLVLEDGMVMEGYAMGKAGQSIGEIVFNTNTSSYQEILTDPTYYGQIVVQTYPLIGNRGVERHSQSEIMAGGYVVREWCHQPTDPAGRVTLDRYLSGRGIVGLCGIDTRQLTRRLRGEGYAKAAITDSIENLNGLLQKIRAYSISGAVKAVTPKSVTDMPAENERLHMAVLDYGCNRSMYRWFAKRGVSMRFFPAYTAAEDLLQGNFDGIMLSDGPGDPDDDETLLQNIHEITASGIPLFGIGLGHQMLGMACGFTCGKMDHAHRGSNQPVRNVETGKLMITTQNHGYAIRADSVDAETAEILLQNVNDHTVEALVYRAFPGLTIQFEPKDGTGLQETAWLYDKMVGIMEEGKQHA